jgi:uncharacterized membrane protein
MKILKWVVAIVVCAWLGQYLLAAILPYAAMELIYARGTKQMGYNEAVVAPVSDEHARTIVRPSPDLLYASCIYNLEDGPLYIEAPIPERYWSMQLYQMNTDNFAGITNRRDERYRAGTMLRVTLIGPDQTPGEYPGSVIQSPTARGIILFRASAIGNQAQQQAALDATRCTPG